MTRNILTNWWGVITAISGAAAVASGVAAGVFGDGGLQLVGSVAYVVSGVLILSGLAVLQRRSAAGSVMIVVGAASTVLFDVFLLPAVALVVGGGMWTGHLQLSGNVAEPRLQTVPPQPADITSSWYLWLAAAPILFVIGLGALVILGDGLTATGEEDTSLINGLAWLAWALSWLGAIISAGLGIAFGIRQRVARHRTRPA